MADALVDLRQTTALAALTASLSARKALALVADGRQAPDGFAAAYERAQAARVDEATQGIQWVGYFDDAYPRRLRAIPAPPALLRVRGDVGLLSRARLLAVAGTRAPTRFGLTATEAAVAAAAARGFGVVSGLARGVDTAAHQAALAQGVPTVAVLGCGLGRLYPPENRPLAEQIVAAGGALVSELPHETRVAVHQLIARNRLQTGLAVALFLGQTDAKGGSPYTARFAAEQGRPVWCPCPPQPIAPASAGLALLLESPVSELPARLPAFAQAKRLCAALAERSGDRPLARPLERAGLDDFARALEQLAEQEKDSDG